MADTRSGICPHCERRFGPVGGVCPGEDCRPRGYHFIPQAWHQAARDFAHKKGRTLDPLLGRRLERYLLAGKLGEGGMGAVYLAYQQPLHREVAVKVVSGLELTGTTRARFEREARAISVLDHPNIVRLYDYGIAQLEFEVPFMALEYVKHGRTLSRVLGDLAHESGGRIPADVVLSIFEQVLNALAAAHDLGIVHRDMKPDNVMLCRVHGNPHFVKVLDFGLAKAVQEVSGFDGDVSSTGQFLGTPYYMAPEQVSRSGGPRVDARTDLYAVAVMLFEIFAGVRPFEGGTPLEVMIRKTAKEYWPLDLPAGRALPRPLRDFLSRGLQPRQEDRFRDAGEMLEALHAAVSGRTMTAVGPDWKRAGSSEDRPATPPSPAGAAADEEGPTRPIPHAFVPVQDAAAGVGSTTLPARARARWWPYVAAPLVATVLVGGLWWAVSPRRADAPARAETSGEPGAIEPVKTPDTGPWSAAGAGESPPASVAQPQGPPEPTPAPAPPPVRHLSFEVRTSPPGAQVRVDGQDLGASPARYEFEARTDQDLDRLVTVAASLRGHRRETVDVRLRDAAARGVEIRLRPIPRPARERPPSRPAAPGKKFQLK